MGIDPKTLPLHVQRMIAETAPKAQPKPSKYHNEPVVVDGIRFDSKREARVYRRLCLEKKAYEANGEVFTWLRQVPFHLPGGVKYLADFVTFHLSHVGAWDVRVLDAKGFKTKVYQIKKRQVEALFPWKIEEV